MSLRVYIFAGIFESEEAACQYTQPQWEPEPDDTASDAEHTAWEDRNPSHALALDFGVWIDKDFVETIDVDYSYLEDMLKEVSDVDHLKAAIPEGVNILVLVFENAWAQLPSRFDQTKLTYCGEYASSLG